MLQFLSSRSNLFLDVLEILLLFFEPLQFGGKSVTVCAGRLTGLGQAGNLSLCFHRRRSKT
jgi:hypothetical protein